MITLADLLAAGGRLHGTPHAGTFTDISYDSRLTRPGELFLALRTPHADGHDFIPAALAAGATGVLCTWPPASADTTIILADDPAALLGRWAARRLAAVAPLVVGVTGSVGKTSTVRAIAALLGRLGPVFRSRQSFNSLLGLPIALARLRDEDRYAVLEFGADRFGEIEQLAALFPPQIAVVTNIGAAHLDAFGTPDGVARAKGALLAALPANGWAVLNGDDPRVPAMRERTTARVLTFGTSQGCDLRASDIRYSLAGTRFRLYWNSSIFDPRRHTKTHEEGKKLRGPSWPFVDHEGEQLRGPSWPFVDHSSGAAPSHVIIEATHIPQDERTAQNSMDLRVPSCSFVDHIDSGTAGEGIEVSIPLLGAPAVMIALAAIGVALACGVALEQAAQALTLVEPIAGRLRALPARGGATLLDDSYSAALPAVIAALQTLAALPARRRIAVLGPPAALGVGVEAAYAEIGALAGQVADALICNGDWGVAAIQAARHARPAIDASVVYTSSAALAALPSDLGPGDLVLIKGAAAARMERVALGLLEQPERAASTLVRQEPAWRSVRAGAPDRPTWLRIDLDAIGYNVRRLRAIAGVPLMITLKADAYGHGALRVARTALANGATALAVATLGEARALREDGIAAPILVLGYTPPWQAREAVGLSLTCTIFDHDSARALADAADALGLPAITHVKVDTGMARLGVLPNEVGAFLQALQARPGLRVEGLYTHFASADSADETFAHMQLQRFEHVLAEITAAGLRPPVIHAANSAALLRMPGARFDLVRPGIACYGLRPSTDTPLPSDFQPALSFHTEIAQVHAHPAGTPISYGGAFVTQRPAQIATIPVGYADGLRRSPPWREVLVRGRRAPIVGRICMDYALIDVSAIPGVRRGDPVVLIGIQGGQAISADEVAEWLGTISYEVVATILPRVPREVES